MDKNRLLNFKVLPKEVKVRNFCDISISFSLNFDLPKESYLIFRFRGGRNNKNDWYFLQPYDFKEKGYVRLNLTHPVKNLPIVITGKELTIKYLILSEIQKETTMIIKFFNTLVQSLVENNKKIDIIVEIPGKKPIFLENPPSINVINEEFDHISIFCPSIVAIDEEFDVVIRIEDKFYNLVRDFSDTIELFKKLEKDANREFLTKVVLNSKYGGFIRKGRVKLTQSGAYHIEIFYNNTKYVSNPIICQDKPIEKRLYWGFIHGHTNKSDGIRDAEEYFENLIKAGLDFGTTTEHDHTWETSDEDFEEIKNLVKKYNKDGEFVSFFGYEYGTWYTGYGDICIYFYDDNIPILRSDINKYNSTPKLIRNLKNYKGKVLLIGHHTALRPGYRNWDYFDNSIEKLVEIYSSWGNQEYPFAEGNPLPPRYKFFGYGKYARKRGAILERKGGFVRDALQKGYKIGFTAGGDDHFGIYPSGSIDPDNGIYPPGIMAIWAEKLTKESLWKALSDRKCYGTTGPRVIIEFYLENHFMGDIINLNNNPNLINNREIKIKVISPIIISKVEIIRNNLLFKREIVNSDNFLICLTDHESFDDVALNHAQKDEKFVFYYVRIFLSNENMAWSSPIWIIKRL